MPRPRVRKRLWHLVQVIAGLAIVFFVARYVVRNWDQVREADLAWRLSPLHLLGGIALIWLVLALQAEAWRRMVRAWGRGLGWFDSASIWLLSSMAKYIPGKVWALTGMAVMAERKGIPAWAATASALLLQVVSVGTAALVVAGSGFAVLRPHGIGTAVLMGLALGSLLVIGLVLWPPVTTRLVRLVAPKADLTHIPGWRVVTEGALVNLFAWIGFGVSFWLFSRGTLPQAPLGLTHAIAAFTASYVAGMIAPFAPGGLGVRESILVIALQGSLGLANALGVAAVSRIGSTAAEVVATIPFLVRGREIQRG